LFVALIIGYLLHAGAYRALFWAALFGIAMPVTDAWLAFSAQAPTAVIVKHLATAGYLLLTAGVLFRLGSARADASPASA
jgi:hypothetical protein